ncbi:MAG: decaprenyl-phosphate phosphoribosyltransferase [Planctomycetota bacterium]
MERLLPYLLIMRPAQWSKNVFVFAGLIFGRRLTDPHSVLLAVLAFICFSLLSSCVYIINDIHDRNEDQSHPRKCKRPLAAGLIGVRSALFQAVAVLVIGLVGAWFLHPAFCLVGLLYLLLQTAYTFALKHVVLLDVVCIGIGFVLRAVAGAVVIKVDISPWLVVCTFTLCLFMGFSKRRCEITALTLNGNNDAGSHRRTLSLYTSDLLNHFTTLTAGVAIVSFLLYATDDRTVREFETNYLVYTLPLVIYAVFRFMYLVEHGLVDGPTDVMTRDKSFQAALLLWTIAAIVIVYRGPELGEWLKEYLSQPT